jgi:hypothetical protein
MFYNIRSLNTEEVMSLLFRVRLRVAHRAVATDNGELAEFGKFYRAPGGGYEIRRNGEKLTALLYNHWGKIIEQLDMSQDGLYLLTPFDSHMLDHEVDADLVAYINHVAGELARRVEKNATFEVDIRPLGGRDMPVVRDMDRAPTHRLTDGQWTNRSAGVRGATFVIFAWRREENDTIDDVRIWVARTCKRAELHAAILSLAKPPIRRSPG